MNLDQAAIMEARTKVTARTSLMGAGELSLPDENSSLESTAVRPRVPSESPWIG